ncbi:GNAT family N-acetyltransferase [Chryseobacterium sp.]|uniref:GNAT family N-acetyltransferase n=1 Tax=Chryseobacterium sp. TaxID=1871047 RepID=UPI0011CC37BE|nr:GNAT family N-acetyltransferase [Chryseobacterium sp.]TXF75039.1 GNAT family N-acetyltransferase [Chryseobacterium sp.]
MIILKCLNKKDLEQFIHSGEYESFDFLPITKHRALSQIQNPKADEDDVLLSLAFENGKLAGYLGSLPDLLTVDSMPVKYAWLSTVYVNENFRGKKIAQQLLQKVFERYNGKIAMTEFTKEAENLYMKTGKVEYITSKKGQRFYFRTDFETLIPRKKTGLSKLKPIFKTVDLLANSLVSAKRQLEKSKSLHFEIKDDVDEESERFISHFPSTRTAAELNLIIRNPWILEGRETLKKYLFSSYSKDFKYFWVKIYDDSGHLSDGALLQMRDGHLKIPYLFSKGDLEDFVNFLKNFIIEKKIKTLISYHTHLNEQLISGKFPKLYHKNAERKYLYHKDLLKVLPENFDPHYQDGDGDPVFT